MSLFIVLAFTTLGTVTYAWLSVSTTNTIDTLDLGAEGDNYLELSLDGISFNKTINSKDLLGKLKRLDLTDVTSNDGKTIFNRNGTVANANEDYISFDVWVRAKRFDKVYLVDNNINATYENLGSGTAVASRGINWKASNTFLYAPNDIVQAGEYRVYYGDDAVRLGLVERNVNGFYGVNDQRDESELATRIIDPSGDTARGYGEEYGQYDFWKKMRPDQILTIPDVKPDTMYEFTTFREDNMNVAKNDNTIATNLFTSTQPYGDGENEFWKVGKFTVNIWLEGWDADCFDAIYDDLLRVQLSFQVGR